MPEDLLEALTRFHREVALPDIDRLIDNKIDRRIAPFQERVLSILDDVVGRLERLENEYASLKAAVDRLEDRMTAVDQKLDRMALKSELLELKDRVAALEQRIAEIEASLG